MSGVETRFVPDTRDELAEACYDVCSGRESRRYDFKPAEHEHRSILPSDKGASPWPIWRRVADAIENWPVDHLKSADPKDVRRTMYDEIRKEVPIDAGYEQHTAVPMLRVATFAVRRAEKLAVLTA